MFKYLKRDLLGLTFAIVAYCMFNVLNAAERKTFEKSNVNGLPKYQITSGVENLHKTIQIDNYNPKWPQMYEKEAACIKKALNQDLIEIFQAGIIRNS